MTEDRTPFGFQVLSAFFRLLQGCSHGLVRLRSARFVRFCSDLFEFVRIRFISLAPVLAVLPTVAGNTGDWKVSRTIGSELRQPCTAVCMDDLSRSCVLWLGKGLTHWTQSRWDTRPWHPTSSDQRERCRERAAVYGLEDAVRSSWSSTSCSKALSPSPPVSSASRMAEMALCAPLAQP